MNTEEPKKEEVSEKELSEIIMKLKTGKLDSQSKKVLKEMSGRMEGVEPEKLEYLAKLIAEVDEIDRGFILHIYGYILWIWALIYLAFYLIGIAIVYKGWVIVAMLIGLFGIVKGKLSPSKPLLVYGLLFLVAAIFNYWVLCYSIDKLANFFLANVYTILVIMGILVIIPLVFKYILKRKEKKDPSDIEFLFEKYNLKTYQDAWVVINDPKTPPEDKQILSTLVGLFNKINKK